MGKTPLFISITKISYIHATKHLNAEQVNKLFKAGEQAHKLGYPLNRFITIHYDDYADRKRPQTFILDYLEHTRKWLKRRGLPVAYLYTLENGKNKGIHAHILLHIPNGYQVKYKKAMAGWLPFEIKKPWIDFKAVQYPTIGELHPFNPMYGRLRYICKGIDPDTPLHDITAINQGEIMGRRWGISNSLKA